MYLVMGLSSNEFINSFVYVKRDFAIIESWTSSEFDESTLSYGTEVSVCRPEHKITREQARWRARTHKFGAFRVKPLKHNSGVSFATCEATCVYLGIVPRILVRYYETAENWHASGESTICAHTRARAKWIMSVVSFRVCQPR